MSKLPLSIIAPVALVLSLAAVAAAFEPYMVKESSGPSGSPPACPLAPNINGTCGNLRYYNSCSGYIWIFGGIPTGDAYGTRFDGPCAGQIQHRVKRAITYYRNTVPSYGQTVDMYLHVDNNHDGCPDAVMASDLNLDPGERWNCSAFSMCIWGYNYSVIVRSVKRGSSAPDWATDGPYTSVCDPNGIARSFYYPATGGCFPWIVNSPTGRNDNFLTHLIVDNDSQNCGPVHATEKTTWGNVKGIYR